MNKKFLRTLTLLLPFMASAEIENPARFVLGVDALSKNVPYVRGQGDNLFLRTHYQYNISLGVRFNDYLGLFVGREAGGARTRNNGVTAGERFNNVILTTADGTQNHNGLAKLRGTTMDLMLYIPLHELNVEAFVGMGAIHQHVKLEDQWVSTNGVALAPPTVSVFQKGKLVPRGLLGAQTYFNQNLGMRAYLAYENTAQFKNLTSPQSTNAETKVSLGNATLIGVGLFLRFG